MQNVRTPEKQNFQLSDSEKMQRSSSDRDVRFVLAIKEDDRPRETWKARPMVQGFRDNMKTSLVHDKCNARAQAVRVFVSTATSLIFEVFAIDICQAFPQSAKNLLADVYNKSPKELEVQSGNRRRLLKPLFGPTDSGDY